MNPDGVCFLKRKTKTGKELAVSQTLVPGYLNGRLSQFVETVLGTNRAREVMVLLRVKCCCQVTLLWKQNQQKEDYQQRRTRLIAPSSLVWWFSLQHVVCTCEMSRFTVCGKAVSENDTRTNHGTAKEELTWNDKKRHWKVRICHATKTQEVTACPLNTFGNDRIHGASSQLEQAEHRYIACTKRQRTNRRCCGPLLFVRPDVFFSHRTKKGQMLTVPVCCLTIEPRDCDLGWSAVVTVQWYAVVVWCNCAVLMAVVGQVTLTACLQ